MPWVMGRVADVKQKSLSRISFLGQEIHQRRIVYHLLDGRTTGRGLCQLPESRAFVELSRAKLTPPKQLCRHLQSHLSFFAYDAMSAFWQLVNLIVFLLRVVLVSLFSLW